MDFDNFDEGDILKEPIAERLRTYRNTKLGINDCWNFYLRIFAELLSE